MAKVKNLYWQKWIKTLFIKTFLLKTMHLQSGYEWGSVTAIPFPKCPGRAYHSQTETEAVTDKALFFSLSEWKWVGKFSLVLFLCEKSNNNGNQNRVRVRITYFVSTLNGSCMIMIMITSNLITQYYTILSTISQQNNGNNIINRSRSLCHAVYALHFASLFLSQSQFQSQIFRDPFIFSVSCSLHGKVEFRV